jgi:hypothetical protein
VTNVAKSWTTTEASIENGVRALLREAGLKVGTPSRKNFATRVGELVADDPVLAALAESLLVSHRHDDPRRGTA